MVAAYSEARGPLPTMSAGELGIRSLRYKYAAGGCSFVPNQKGTLRNLKTGFPALDGLGTQGLPRYRFHELAGHHRNVLIVPKHETLRNHGRDDVLT